MAKILRQLRKKGYLIVDPLHCNASILNRLLELGYETQVDDDGTVRILNNDFDNED